MGSIDKISWSSTTGSGSESHSYESLVGSLVFIYVTFEK